MGTKTSNMKFAVACLIATTAAIRIQSECTLPATAAATTANTVLTDGCYHAPVSGGGLLKPHALPQPPPPPPTKTPLRELMDAGLNQSSSLEEDLLNALSQPPPPPPMLTPF